VLTSRRRGDLPRATILRTVPGDLGPHFAARRPAGPEITRFARCPGSVVRRRCGCGCGWGTSPASAPRPARALRYDGCTSGVRRSSRVCPWEWPIPPDLPDRGGGRPGVFGSATCENRPG